MTTQVVAVADVAPQPWRNGGGLTRELLRWPPGPGDEWQLRITLAEVGRDGPFSAFPGVRRHFAVVAGGGLRLRWPPDDTWRDLPPGHPPLSFDGEQAPDCRLLSPQPSLDLNLMTRGPWAGGLQPMQLQGDTASVTWPTRAHRGFFAMAPGRWRRGGGPAQALAAQTLVWRAPEGASGAAETWSFSPGNPATAGPPCGWWLAAQD